MRRLPPADEDKYQTMKSERIVEFLKQPTARLTSDSVTQIDSKPLEINVIHTEPQATTAALIFAERLARDLRASIHLHAVIIVPPRLPIDQSPVSVHFMERILCGLVQQATSGDRERTVHLYVCRDRVDTLLKVLMPRSVVIIGGRKHLWPTAVSRIGKELVEHGHDVVFVDAKRQGTRAA